MTAFASGYLSSPHSVVIAVVLVMIAVAAYRARNPGVGIRPAILGGTGALLIAVAAGEPVISYRDSGSVTVMVDLSPSTRGAAFRDRSILDNRLHQLLGDRPFRLVAFADAIRPIPAGQRLPDIPVDRTVFPVPTSDAVVLFSDGRFDLPAAGPPIYPVIDPSLNTPGDASVSQLLTDGTSVVATVSNTGGSRSLQWTHATPRTPPASTGSFQQYARPDGSDDVTAALSPGDRWPENDSLSIRPFANSPQERWWVGDGAPAGWRPVELPAHAADYLRTTAIVLRNIPADRLSTEQQQRLVQYVRDLGGSLTIVGGDHAFSAGGYDGTAVDALSPLASSPPEPAIDWVLLVDGSGSMAGTGGSGPSPWQIESDAVAGLIPRLPPNDPVSVGNFADDLSWWTTGKSARETARLRLPPPTAFPHGPTNLAPVLRAITASADGSTATELLVMTDADTEMPNADSLGSQMVQKKIHLHVLATGHGTALAILRAIAAATGGSVVEQRDPRQWVPASQMLLRQAMPMRYEHSPATVQFTNSLSRPLTVTEWNRTWLRSDATPVARASEIPMAAHWQYGSGRVTAVAFPADPATITAVSASFESKPRDPRFSVSSDQTDSCTFRVTAIDGGQFLNDLAIRLETRDSDDLSRPGETRPIPQTGPGRYELTIPAPRRSQIVTVFNGSQILEYFPLAGRYAPEFDRIGNDGSALQELARRTGGSVVPPGSIRPIDFRWPVRHISIAPELAFAGFLTLAAALLLARRSEKH